MYRENNIYINIYIPQGQYWRLRHLCRYATYSLKPLMLLRYLALFTWVAHQEYEYL